MKRFVKENGLGLFFGAIFLGSLVGQALVGHADFNHVQAQHHDDPISLGRYVLSSDFGVDVMENWQSEYLQFTLYVFMTVWLLQRGAPESKEPGKEGLETDEEQKVGEHATAESPRWARVGHKRLLEPHAAELAVRVPRRRLDGRARDLPPPARLAGVQVRRRAARRDGG